MSQNGLDPRLSLATTLHSQPGIYALLLGSGVSTGAGMPTGWGVVSELVRRIAAARGDDPPEDAEEWWAEHGDGKALGYSGLLEALAPTAAARRGLLAEFFEPSEEDREDDRKVPGPAHRAIARLVARGTIRVILTTNFDRLIEQALEAEGILPQIIASTAAAIGMEPLVHARCTVVKLHGDYASLDQLSTVEELTSYPDELRDLLRRILDEYGLIVCGWSGDWDHALVSEIAATKPRRYPLYWSAYSELGDVARRLVAEHRGVPIVGFSADDFLTDVIERLESLDTLANPPLTRAMAIAQLKRYLPDGTKRILLGDLLEEHVGRVRDALAHQPRTLPRDAPANVEQMHEDLRQRSDTLLHLLARGVFLDRDRDHTDLWIRVVEQLMRARSKPDGTFNQIADNLQHYPALLALRTAVLAAVATRHDDVVLRLLSEPTWRDPFGDRKARAAADALHDYKVLDHDVINMFPIWNGTKWLYARSHLLRHTLRPVFDTVVPDDESYVELCNRAEYRIALAQRLSEGSYRSAPGEFIGEWSWDGDHLRWEHDFRSHADLAAWGFDPEDPAEMTRLDEALGALAEELAKSRRWG